MWSAKGIYNTMEPIGLEAINIFEILESGVRYGSGFICRP